MKRAMRPSPNSLIVKRPLLFAVTVNLGVIVAEVIFYLQGIDVQLVAWSGIATLAFVNALVWFMRKWAGSSPTNHT
jgi:hypothetical protein